MEEEREEGAGAAMLTEPIRMAVLDADWLLNADWLMVAPLVAALLLE